MLGPYSLRQQMGLTPHTPTATAFRVLCTAGSNPRSFLYRRETGVGWAWPLLGLMLSIPYLDSWTEALG